MKRDRIIKMLETKHEIEGAAERKKGKERKKNK